MSQLSTTRKVLRGLGVGSGILGVILIILSIMAPPASYYYQPGPEELGVFSGETNLFRIAGVFFGFVFIYLGYRAFKYIPKSEREKETVDDTY